MSFAVVEIRPDRGGWRADEGGGVRPLFAEPDAKEKAISYSTHRMRSRRGEIRIYNIAGELEQTVAFDPDVRQV